MRASRLFAWGLCLLVGCGGTGGGGDGGLVVRIVSPEDGQRFLTPETVHFECRAERSDGQNAPAASYEWRIQPADLTLFGRTASSQLPEGDQSVVCKAEDPESGEYGEAEVAIQVGDAVVKIMSPADGARMPESFDGSGVSNAIAFVAVGRSVAAAGGTYTWNIGSISGLIGQTVLTSVPVGRHDVEVRYQDPEGNDAADAIGIEVLSRSDWTACLATVETCNGVDDNCNGEVDEGFQSCGVGGCVRRIALCDQGGDRACVPGDPAPEECNGQDDDCDGITDELDGDIQSLCEDPDRVCVRGHCERFEVATGCAACPCDRCGEVQGMRQCCELPGVSGAEVICLRGDWNQDGCPVP